MKSRKVNKHIKEQWDYLTSHFTPEYIETMSDMKEYVVGFGSQNKSFCYLVEVELKELGDIRGATSAKFGIWYGTHGKDRTRKYRTTKQHFNGDVNKAFADIKVALAQLIRETKLLTEFKNIDSILSGMFKYKIMYLYNPNIMLPSFIEEDLRHFEEKLGLKPSRNFEKSQMQLMKYKNENYHQLSNHDFMSKLYDDFGKYNVASINRENEERDNKLNKDISNGKDPKDKYITCAKEKVAHKKAADGVYYYPRDTKMALYALANANHKCENNPGHKCFIRRSNGMPYTEVHHLVPLCFYDDFESSLDVPENIVSLCSSCHNEIHYGKDADIIITKLFYERKDKLKEAGIDAALDELLKMHHKINEQK